MADDIDEIRRKKARELMESLSTKTEEEYEKDYQAAQDLMPWSFRLNIQTGVTEICHHPQMKQSDDDPNVVALAMDPEWADMVTDMLNRAFLVHESGMADQLAGGLDEQ